tara:strand:+ start:4160 stop:4345 length:186 start_codon:yes stop_codon:yes gene_type:complete
MKEALKIYLEGKRAYHVANWNCFIANPVGVAEHGDFMETLEQTLEQIAKYDELLATLKSLS